MQVSKLTLANCGIMTPEMSVNEAADTLRAHPRTIRRWLASGKLCGRKVSAGAAPATWRIDAVSVQALSASLPGGQTPGQNTRAGDGQASASLVEQVRLLRGENAEYRRAIEQLAGRVAELSARVEQLQLALPSPEAERRPWWRRLWRGGAE